MTYPYQPKEAAAKIGIADSTLRVWAPRYAAFLSEYANRGRRTFTERDLAVLAAVRDMAGQNMTHEAIAARLPALEFPEETPVTQETPAGDAGAQGATMALVQVMATSHSAQLADAAQRITQQDAVILQLVRDLEAVQRALDHVTARLEALEGKVGSVGEFMHGHTGPVRIWTRKEG